MESVKPAALQPVEGNSVEAVFERAVRIRSIRAAQWMEHEPGQPSERREADDPRLDG